MLTLVLSICVCAFADEESTPADDPVISESSDTWNVIWDNAWNQYSVYGYTSVYGNNVETGTWFGDIVPGDGRQETITYVIQPMNKTYGANYTVYFWIGNDSMGNLNHSASGTIDDTYVAAYYGYMKTPLSVNTSHKFSCNGAYWVSGTDY